MKAVLFVLFAIAVSTLAIAAGPLVVFVNTSFEPDQNVTGAPLLPGNTVYIIIADGVETYAYDTAANSAMNDSSALSALLEADSKSRSGFEQKVASARAFAAQVRDAKNASEQHCMQLTGTQMHECSDKDTCVFACMSNPNCANPLYSDGFWESILDWTNERLAFDSALSTFDTGIDSVSADASAIDSKLSALDELSAKAHDISQDLLFLNRTDEGCMGANATKRCFEYCGKIDYSAPAIAAQKKNLQDLKAALLDVQKQPARAAAILAAGANNSLYDSAKGGQFAALRVKMAGDLTRLNRASKELSAKVDDTQIQPMLDSLSALSAKIEAEGKDGRYRAAFSDQKIYESLLSQASDRISSDLLKYDGALAQIGEVLSKANNSSWLIGQASYAKYAAQLTALQANLTSAPAPLGAISSAGAEAAEIQSSMSDEISAKAAQGGAAAPQQQQSSGKGLLPCLPAFIVLAVAGFAFFRKSG